MALSRLRINRAHLLIAPIARLILFTKADWNRIIQKKKPPFSQE
jgi:hypothetical protein